MTPISSTVTPMWPRYATPCFHDALNPRSVTMKLDASAKLMVNMIKSGMGVRTPA